MEFAKNLTGEKQQRTIAGLFRGKWTSAFSEQPTPDSDNSTTHKSTADKEGLILVINDVDFLSDQNSVQAYGMFGQTVIDPLNDNLAFFLNAVETLSGKEELIRIRTKAKVSRPFTKLLDLQEAAQEKYQEEEKKLSAQLEQVQAKLSEINSSQVQNGQVILSDEQLTSIEQFEQEQVVVKKRLRELRKMFREDIESLGSYLKFVNMVPVTLAIFVFGLVVYFRRTSAKNRGVQS